MSKKSALRKLHIDTQAFLYRITALDKNYVKVKVWSSSVGNKNNFIQVKIRFDNPWLNYPVRMNHSTENAEKLFRQPVTPSQVKQLVEHAMATGWDIQAEKQTRSFTWDNEQLLATTEVF